MTIFSNSGAHIPVSLESDKYMTLTNIAVLYAKADRYEQSKTVVKSIMAMGKHHSWADFALADIVQVLLEKGMYDLALETSLAMKDKDSKLEALSKIACALAQAGSAADSSVMKALKKLAKKTKSSK